MKAILDFDLPEDRNAFEVASKGMDWALLVWRLEEQIRKWKKYGEHTVPEENVMNNVLHFIREDIEDKGLIYPE